MKIALVIFRIGPSHGSILQTYALYRTLYKMGHEVSILNRQHKMSIYRKLKNIIARIKGRILNSYKGPVFYTKDYSSLSMRELNTFIQKYLKSNLLTFSTRKELNNIVDLNFDCYIVGSDQTWRPKYVHDVKYYFLDFLPINSSAKRIAYAPSFGTSEWEFSPKLTKECKEYLSKFSAVSVREDAGVILCKKYFNIQALHVLDPTFLLAQKDYLCLIHKISCKNSPTLAFSILDNSELAVRIVQKVCFNLNIKPYQINASHKSTVKNWIEPGIEKWLEGILQSKFVVTDSFHATVFAIIFNKPFITIVNVSRGSSRILSLLTMFGLENRMVDSIDQVSDKLLYDTIDWDVVNRIIEKERNKSINWLKEALK